MMHHNTPSPTRLRLDVAHPFLPKQNSVRAAQVMDHFGIDFEQGSHVIARRLELPVIGGGVILFTGASGSGKSSLMRALRRELESMSCMSSRPSEASGSAALASSAESRPACVVLEELNLPESLLVDALPLPVSEALQLLSACGLGEAQLLLRTPAELSDGQRYRFRLALALAQRPAWIVADEFTATLDRTLARVVACNLRRQADRTGTGFLLATTHEDLVDDLDPDLWVQCRLDGCISLAGRLADPAAPGGAGRPSPGNVSAGPARRVKKKRCRFSASYGSVAVPRATGRTSLGGITEVITWE